MQFTPQQLSGGARFSCNTRIGNWQEEITVAEAKLETFQKRTASGGLSLNKQAAKLVKANEIVPHSYLPDGLIKFGDSLILNNVQTNTILACDPYEEITFGTSRYLVTTFVAGKNPSPRARNVFKVVRPPVNLLNIQETDNTDPYLRFGQSFQLIADESLLVIDGSSLLSPTLYLNSTKKNERNATKTTNRQLVYLSPSSGADSIWTVVKPSMGKKNGMDKYMSLGQPISVSDLVQITHRQTNMYLTCDPAASMKSEFGIEFELFADRAVACGKLALMVSEMKGISTTQTLSKPDAPQFAWHFVGSENEAAGIDNRSLPPRATPEVLISKMRDFIISRGIDAFWSLRLYLQELEKRAGADTNIDRDDLKEALQSWGCPFDSKYLDGIIDLLDHRKVGMIDWRSFISLLRGDANSNRDKEIENVFFYLSNNDIKVNVEVLQKAFTGMDHPFVAYGNISVADAFDQMLKCMLKAVPAYHRSSTKPNNNTSSSSNVTLTGFKDYYLDVSAGIDDNSYFEAILFNNWGYSK